MTALVLSTFVDAAGVTSKNVNGTITFSNGTIIFPNGTIGNATNSSVKAEASYPEDLLTHE